MISSTHCSASDTQDLLLVCSLLSQARGDIEIYCTVSGWGVQGV